MRDIQLPFGADRHQGQRFDPTWDHAANREFCRLAALYGAVEHVAVNQTTGVMHAHAILTGRDWAIALLQHGELQTGFGQRHFVTLGIFFQELLTFNGHCLLALTTHGIRTLVNFTQCTMYHVYRNRRGIPFQRVTQTCQQSFRL
ncbi:hypothetical protein D3C79_931480 [compost metagenome]